MRRLAMLTAMMGGATYKQKLVSVFGANLISAPDLSLTSGATVPDLSGNGRTVAITGWDLANAAGPDGKPTIYADGVNDYGDWYSASLNTALNKGEFTLGIWVKVNSAAIWTNGLAHYAADLEANSSNYIRLQKTTTNSYLEWVYKAGGTTKFGDITPMSTTDWYFTALSVSRSAGANGEMKTFGAIKGAALAQIGATVTGLGTWSGDLAENYTLIGAISKTPTLPWYGWLAYPMLINGPQTLETMQKVML